MSVVTLGAEGICVCVCVVWVAWWLWFGWLVAGCEL